MPRPRSRLRAFLRPRTRLRWVLGRLRRFPPIDAAWRGRRRRRLALGWKRAGDPGAANRAVRSAPDPVFDLERWEEDIALVDADVGPTLTALWASLPAAEDDGSA